MEMITIEMHKSGFNIKGHANYAKHGEDIVCASVSTILQLAQMGLRVLAKQYPSHIKIINVHDGYNAKLIIDEGCDDCVGGTTYFEN